MEDAKKQYGIGFFKLIFTIICTTIITVIVVVGLLYYNLDKVLEKIGPIPSRERIENQVKDGVREAVSSDFQKIIAEQNKRNAETFVSELRKDPVTLPVQITQNQIAEAVNATLDNKLVRQYESITKAISTELKSRLGDIGDWEQIIATATTKSLSAYLDNRLNSQQAEITKAISTELGSRLGDTRDRELALVTAINKSFIASLDQKLETQNQAIVKSVSSALAAKEKEDENLVNAERLADEALHLKDYEKACFYLAYILYHRPGTADVAIKYAESLKAIVERDITSERYFEAESGLQRLEATLTESMLAAPVERISDLQKCLADASELKSRYASAMEQQDTEILSDPLETTSDDINAAATAEFEKYMTLAKKAEETDPVKAALLLQSAEQAMRIRSEMSESLSKDDNEKITADLRTLQQYSEEIAQKSLLATQSDLYVKVIDYCDRKIDRFKKWQPPMSERIQFGARLKEFSDLTSEIWVYDRMKTGACQKQIEAIESATQDILKQAQSITAKPYRDTIEKRLQILGDLLRQATRKQTELYNQWAAGRISASWRYGIQFVGKTIDNEKEYHRGMVYGMAPIDTMLLSRDTAMLYNTSYDSLFSHSEDASKAEAEKDPTTKLYLISRFLEENKYSLSDF